MKSAENYILTEYFCAPFIDLLGPIDPSIKPPMSLMRILTRVVKWTLTIGTIGFSVLYAMTFSNLNRSIRRTLKDNNITKNRDGQPNRYWKQIIEEKINPAFSDDAMAVYFRLMHFSSNTQGISPSVALVDKLGKPIEVSNKPGYYWVIRDDQLKAVQKEGYGQFLFTPVIYTPSFLLSRDGIFSYKKNLLLMLINSIPKVRNLLRRKGSLGDGNLLTA